MSHQGHVGEERGERGRLARGGWRPAKHIFAQTPLRRAALCASITQTQTLEQRTEAECRARRTARRPGRSRSQNMPILSLVKITQTDALGQNVANSYAATSLPKSYNPKARTHRFDLFRPIPTKKINPKTPKNIPPHPKNL